MKREVIAPRPDALARVAALGMAYVGTEAKPYWNEKVCYHFSQAEIEEIESATLELHNMCLNAVQYVIDHDLFDRLHIPPKFVPYIKQSWQQGDPFLYGRFDLAYDGVHPPKMLEYNADTPTGLVEASMIQHFWLNENKEMQQLPENADQYNFIHESLVPAWKRVAQELAARGIKADIVHLAASSASIEDTKTVHYLADTAKEAGLTDEVLDLCEIGAFDEKDGPYDKRFFDANMQPINVLFKLHPWEFISKERFGSKTLNNQTIFIEPVWKMLLSNKGIMAILWEMYPDHPNLLPTFDCPDKITGPYVQKPFISREGANVSICGTVDAESTSGAYGEGPCVYQAYSPLPNFDGRFPIVGSWVTGNAPRYFPESAHPRGGEPCGIGIREDGSRITNNESNFVPHYFTPAP
jgi:glutathionylspermidine synthase